MRVGVMVGGRVGVMVGVRVAVKAGVRVGGRYPDLAIWVAGHHLRYH